MLKTRKVIGIILCLSLGLALTSCGVFSGQSSPEQVIDAYWQARLENDTEKVQELTAPVDFGDCQDSIAVDTTPITQALDEQIPIESFEVLGDPVVIGDRATVKTRIKRAVGILTVKNTVVAELQRRDGQWLVTTILLARDTHSPEILKHVIVDEQNCKNQ